MPQGCFRDPQHFPRADSPRRVRAHLLRAPRWWLCVAPQMLTCHGRVGVGTEPPGPYLLRHVPALGEKRGLCPCHLWITSDCRNTGVDKTSVLDKSCLLPDGIMGSWGKLVFCICILYFVNCCGCKYGKTILGR